MWLNKMIGKKYNRLLVLDIGTKTQSGIQKFKCVCDCGNELEVIGRNLKNGHSKSCGCLGKEIIKARHAQKGYLDISLSYWSALLTGAKQRNIDVTISIVDIWKLYEKQDKRCALSGVKIYFDRGNQTTTASVDRIDSNKGYTTDNIQLVHKKINIMKGILTQEEFIQICALVADNNMDDISLFKDSHKSLSTDKLGKKAKV